MSTLASHALRTTHPTPGSAGPKGSAPTLTKFPASTARPRERDNEDACGGCFSCLLPSLLAADDHWMKFTSGPIEVFTDAGSRAGRETLVRFEEFRHALGQIVGEQDLQTPQPVRILVFKNAKGWTSPAALVEGRDRYAIVLQEKSTVSPAIYTALTRLFLKSNTAQMPPAFEHGLVEFFSTFEVNGIRITVGTPPAQPDLDWARIHLMVADPEYFGKIRVLLYNLRKGVDEDPAYRNAFGKSAADIEAQAKQHFAAGNLQTTSLSSRPMAESDFPERRSPTPMPAWRARTCWPAPNRPPNTRSCSADKRRSPKPKKASDCWRCASAAPTRRASISPPPWRPAAAARAATSNTPGWSRTTKRPTRRCSKPRHQSEAR